MVASTTTYRNFPAHRITSGNESVIVRVLGGGSAPQVAIHLGGENTSTVVVRLSSHLLRQLADEVDEAQLDCDFAAFDGQINRLGSN